MDEAMESMMDAVVIDAIGQPRVARIARPEARPGELRARVRLVGLCGSDVEKLGDASLEHGVLGHELVADAIAGPLPPGTRVVILHRVECGACEECLRGHGPMCAQYLASGLRPGGFAEELVASAAHVERSVLVVPDHLSDEEAVLVEPLACVLRALERAPVGRALVVGGGIMGQLAVRALVARGDLVELDEPAEARLQLGVAAGAVSPDPIAAVDVAFVTVAAGLAPALRRLRVGGTALVFSAGADVQLVDLDLIYRRELTLRGARSADSGALRTALDTIAAGRVDVHGLVTEVLPLERFAEGLELYRSRRTLKVAFRP